MREPGVNEKAVHTRDFTRRTWISGAGASAAILAGCGRQPASAQQSEVSIVRAPAYDQTLYDTIRRTIEMHRLEVRGKNVVLKPNLVEFEPDSVINTNPLVVHAAHEAFLALGAESVRIAEGPGHRRNTLDLADGAGYFATVPGFEDLFTDLNTDDVSRVHLPRKVSRIEKLYLPNTALGADLLVSMPKMKTHHWVGATLSMKNFFGTVPGGLYGWPKNVLHWSGIDECIADLPTAFPRTFAIVDGIVGMEGNGPIQGTAKHVGVLVAGRDVAAVDATCARIMRIDPLQMRYLTLAEANGGKIEEAEIRQTGVSIASVATPFKLIDAFRGLRIEGNPARPPAG